MHQKSTTLFFYASFLMALFSLPSLLQGQGCNITDVTVSNVQCLPGFAPVGFQLNVSGTGTGTDFFVSSADGTVADPGPFNYIFGGYINLTPNDIDQLIYTFVVTDANDPSCTSTFTILNPCGGGVCDLDITEGTSNCDNGGTLNDPSDDTFTQNIIIENGSSTGSWSSNSPNNVSGNYGDLVFLGPYSANGGDVTFTITDDNDPNCTITYTVDNPCDDICLITDVLTQGANCGDNGTPGDTSDDFVFFSIAPQGQGLDNGGYSLTTSIGTPSNNIGSYGVFAQYTITPAPGAPPTFTVTITDLADPGCTFTFTLDNPCFSTCNITDPGVGSVTCDDFNSPTSPGDDFAVVELNPTGIGLSGTYIVTSPEVSASPGIGTYGTVSTQQLLNAAQAGDEITLILTDSDDPSCSITITIPNPAPCSTAPSCDINFSQIGNITCDDNGTPNDPSDDTFTFILQIVGTGTSSNGWTANDPLGTTSDYNVITTMGPYPISGGGFPIIVTDNDDPSCTTFSVNIVPPGPCSTAPPCDLTQSTVVTNQCINGNPVFELLVDGNGTGANYTISVTNGTISGSSTGNYGQITPFTIIPNNAGVGQFTVTITDVIDPNCTAISVVPNPCPSCTITASGLSSENCNDNGTPNDPSDDFAAFTVTVNGAGTSGGYTITSSEGPATPATGAYNTAQTFSLPPGSAGNGPTTITLTDSQDPSCTFSFDILNQNVCSAVCTITPILNSTTCNDNGTPGNPSDDVYFANVTVNGTGGPSGWTVFPDFGPDIGAYGSTVDFGPIPISGGVVTLTFTDQNGPTCSAQLTLIPPAPCSVEPCNINTATVITPVCDNGAIDFELLVNGTGTGANYQISTSDGILTAGTSGNYGQITTLTLLPNDLSADAYTIAITDSSDPTCTITAAIDNPCEACTISAATLSMVQCQDNNSPGNPADDFISFEILVNGTSTSGTYTLTAAGQTIQPGSGPFGSPVSFNLLPGSAGGGDITLTITDEADNNCTTTVLLNDPGTCSDACDITALLTATTCIPAGLPEDDFFQATIQVINLAGTAGGWSTQTPLGPVSGNYNQDVQIGPFLISGGSLDLTITDQLNPGCTTSLTVIPPDPCSDVCVADTTLINLESCSPIDTGMTVQNLTGQAGCDSVVITTTALLPNDSTILNETSCSPIDTGTVAQVFTNQFGCDSTVIITTSLVDSDTTLINLQSCNLIDTGTVTQNLTGQTGCDSIVITTTTLLPSDSTLLMQTSCNPVDTGTIVQIFENQFGCDSTLIISTLLVDSDTTLLNLQSCSPADTGTVVQNLTGQAGCDSVVITTTALLPNDSTILNETSCSPIDTGTVAQVFTNQFGCDSTVIITTSLVDSDTTLIDLQSCNLIDTGTVTQNLTGQTGCDSIVITTTTLLPSDSTFLTQTSCNPLDTGTIVQIFENQFGCDSTLIISTLLVDSDTTLLNLQSCSPADTGTVVQNLTGQTGCDSVVITTTALLPSDTTLLFSESCNPLDTGTIAQILTNQFGCDSTVITQTTLLPSDTTLLFSESCKPLDTGTVAQTLTNQFGCDSTVITQTTLLPSDTTLLFSESCNPLDTGTVAQTLTNQFGCDSTVITQTTLLPSDTTLLFSESCNPIDTGTVVISLNNQFGCDSTVITQTTLLPSDTTLLLSESCSPLDTGTVAQTLTNQFGCDSTVITQTTLLPSDTTLLLSESCSPLDTGTVAQTLTNQFGCDSTVITQTTLLPSDTTLLFSESCNPLDTGTVAQNLTNQFGCDSTVITQTTLLPSDTTLLFSESCNPLDTGTVAQNLTNQFGCDSTVITQTTLLPSDTTILFSESCSPQDTGTVAQILANQFGCDSTVITQTTLLPSDTTLLFSESCNPLDTGTVAQNLTNQFGCDSTVITQTTLLPSDTTLLFSESCNPLDTGTVTQTLTNQFGCDSTVITQTTLLPSDTTLLFSESCNPLDTGTVAQNLTNQFGCDSTVITQVLLQSSPTFRIIADTLCAGSSIVVNGIIYDLDRPIGQEVIQSAATGCDSIVIDIVLSFSDPVAAISTIMPPCKNATGAIRIDSFDQGVAPYSLVVNDEPLDDDLALPALLEVAAGPYTVSVEDQLGCTQTQEVTVPEGPDLDLTLASPIDVQVGDTIVFNPILNFMPNQIQWTPAVSNLSCTDCLNPALTALESSTYTIIASIGSNCSARATVQVIVDQRSNVYVPNIFSPNEDGKNDRFTVFGELGRIDLIERMEIYDRWGNQVFIKTTFPPNNVAEGWDGRFRGVLMNAGVFTYYAQVRLSNGLLTTLQGDVTLIR
jgi:gliding motility-associated-like protein